MAESSRERAWRLGEVLIVPTPNERQIEQRYVCTTIEGGMVVFTHIPKGMTVRDLGRSYHAALLCRQGKSPAESGHGRVKQ